jgi:hypothetical protein
MTQALKSVLSAAIDTTGAGGTTGQEVKNVIDSAFVVDVRTVTTLTATVTTDDDYVRLDTTANAVTLTLPALASAGQQQYTFKWVAGANAATIDGDAADIDGGGTYVFDTVGDAIIIRPGPTQWEIVSQYLTGA